MKKKNVYVDPNQGTQHDDRAFGFVGLRESDDTDQYCGWFFTWPRREAKIENVAERDSVLGSLERDETCSGDPAIPYRWARLALAAYLRRFDLRRRM